MVLDFKILPRGSLGKAEIIVQTVRITGCETLCISVFVCVRLTVDCYVNDKK